MVITGLKSNITISGLDTPASEPPYIYVFPDGTILANKTTDNLNDYVCLSSDFGVTWSQIPGIDDARFVGELSDGALFVADNKNLYNWSCLFKIKSDGTCIMVSGVDRIQDSDGRKQALAYSKGYLIIKYHDGENYYLRMFRYNENSISLSVVQTYYSYTLKHLGYVHLITLEDGSYPAFYFAFSERAQGGSYAIYRATPVETRIYGINVPQNEFEVPYWGVKINSNIHLFSPYHWWYLPVDAPSGDNCIYVNGDYIKYDGSGHFNPYNTTISYLCYLPKYDAESYTKIFCCYTRNESDTPHLGELKTGRLSPANHTLQFREILSNCEFNNCEILANGHAIFTQTVSVSQLDSVNNRIVTTKKDTIVAGTSGIEGGGTGGMGEIVRCDGSTFYNLFPGTNHKVKQTFYALTTTMTKKLPINVRMKDNKTYKALELDVDGFMWGNDFAKAEWKSVSTNLICFRDTRENKVYLTSDVIFKNAACLKLKDMALYLLD